MNTYDKLIKAAIEIMNEKGYPGTSIGLLAEKVEISKSTVIHYFKTKEGVLLAILENFLPVYIDEFRPILNDPTMTGLEKLHKFLYFHLRMVADKKDLLSINIRDTKYLTGKNKVIYQNQQRVYEEQVVTIVKQIQKEDTVLFSGLSPKITAKAIIGMCNHVAIWYSDSGPLTIDNIAEQFYTLLTRKPK